MRLIGELQRRLDAEESPFRAQLLREDIGRLARLAELARATPEPDVLRAAARRLGWTPGDLRTHELREPLDALADAVHALAAGGVEAEARVIEAWNLLHRVRMERLVGCLSTPLEAAPDMRRGGR